MLRPTVISPITYFYPLGNTPAVNLTQDLPPEVKDAKLMLAGCGDARNVLFTIYNETGQRSLDFTCCDIEPPILARNILLYSLMPDGEISNSVWDIYFHVAISASSIRLLEKQVQKLLNCSSNGDTWASSQYGRVLGFSNTHTMERVRQVWSRWTTSTLSEDEKEARKKELSDAVHRAQKHKKEKRGTSFTFTSVRSAAPGGLQAPMTLHSLNETYWATGSLESKAVDLQPNPTFLLDVDRSLTVHYGTEPLLGFHLTTAVNPLIADSALRPMLKSVSEYLSKTDSMMLKAAQTEFFCWIKQFSDFPKELLHIRFVAADATAWGHTLQGISSMTGTITAYWPTESWTFERLDIEPIGGQETKAKFPVSFNVIDTSNLCDHLGFLNIAVAYFPLLASHATSTIYTELLVSPASGPDQRIKSLLRGDFDSMCLLLGMTNVESWTNATVDMEADETLLQKAMESMNQNEKKKCTQHRQRLAWKSAKSLIPDAPSVSIEPQGLVDLVMQLHDNMFKHEDLAYSLQNLGKLDLEEMSMPIYNRASFVSVLAYLKNVITTDWSTFEDLLYKATVSPGNSFVGGNYLQDLCVQLHLQKVLSVDILQRPMDKRIASKSSLHLADSENIPAVVCLTIEVPAGNVCYVGDNMKNGIGILSLCCTVENLQGGWSNVFSSVQACFGSVKARSTESRQLATLEVQEAKVHWNGRSPMVVSVYIPTWILLQSSEGTTVSVGFQPTPITAVLNRKLGPNLRLYTMNLSSSSCVYLSKFMPRLDQLPLIVTTPSKANESETTMLTQVLLNKESTKIDRIQRRILVNGTHKISLAEKTTAVQVSQMTPVLLVLRIGTQSAISVDFPRPVSAKYSKLRIARKSAYIEIIAPLMNPMDVDMQQSWMFPVILSPSSDQTAADLPIAWSMPYMNVSRMPQIDLEKPSKLEWSNPHTSQMFSVRERTIRDGNLTQNTSYASSPTPRVDFKDGLLNIFAFVTQTGGVTMGRSMVFGLHRPNDDGMHVLIFVSAAILDINNRTIALDAAVLPLTMALVMNPQYNKVFSKIDPTVIRPINMSKDELLVWKHNLPAFVERCRTWSHKPESCEYIKEGLIPLPSGLEDGASSICSCGRGILPDSFTSNKYFKPFSGLIKKHATRMVLSPTFAVPHVEPCSDLPESAKKDQIASEAREKFEGLMTGCAQCGANEKKDAKHTNRSLSKCSRCLKVAYCSRECQQKHWKASHKSVCKKAADHS